MQAVTLFKGYGVYGLTAEMAAHVKPSDVRELKKRERELADAILADKKSHLEENGLDVPVMKRRVANLKRGSNYIDYTLSPIERLTQPRGVILSYPEGGGFGTWHGNKWTTSKRIRFDWELKNAHKAVEKHEREGYPVRATQVALVEIGNRWEHAVVELIDVLRERVDE